MAIQPFFHTGPMDNGVYLVIDPESRECAIVDPGLDSERIWDVVAVNNLTMKYVLNTHGHFDHIANNAFFAEKSGAGVWIHAADMSILEGLVSSGMRFGIEC